MLRSNDYLSLALVFHLNSEPWVNESGPIENPYQPEFKRMATKEPVITLPVVAEQSSVADLAIERRSCRAYIRQPMEVSILASILSRTYSAHVEFDDPLDIQEFSRTVPSAGGLYPLEVYVVLERIIGVPDGLYHYNMLEHGLESLRRGAFLKEIAKIALDQYFLTDVNIILVLSGVFARTLRKYGPRGYRYVLFEAGHAAQNCCLAATEYALGSVPIGGFRDSLLNRLIGIDGYTEAALYCIAMGFRAD